ncbi:MAG: glycosyltransferase family 9 protein [bacterium]
MRGKYLVRSAGAFAALSLADAVLSLLPRDKPADKSGDLRRVLIGVGGHLGDAVMATGALGLIARTRPDLELGIAAGNWSAEVFRGHPAVRWLHAVDHWKLNRSPLRLPEKLRHSSATTRAAVAAIRKVRYDAAVDLYPFFPNMASLFARAGVPIRIGYSSGGLGALYTDAVTWTHDQTHMTAKHARLVAHLFAAPDAAGRELQYQLPPATSAVNARVDALLARPLLERFIVLHPGAGAAQKEWPLARWKALAAEFRDRGYTIVVTGAGIRDEASARQIIANVPECVDLTGRVTWPEFVEVVRRAALVISGDTAAAHVAAACGTRQVALFSGITDSVEWRPAGLNGKVLMQPVPCAPCFRNDGCDSMTCIRGVGVAQVVGTAIEILNDSGRP